MRLIHGLREIAEGYDVILSDVWGVIHNGRVSFPEACEALAWFARERGPVVLISNAARLSKDVVPQLDGLGVPRAAWTDFVSSGDATRPILAELAPAKVWAIGPERVGPLYEGLGLAFAGPEDADFISCTGPQDDQTETPEDYRARFEVCVSRGLDMVCANPDLVVQHGDKLIYCGGALAELYVAMGGSARMAGKPHAPIYRMCLDRAEHHLGRRPDHKRVLCIGDAAATDLRGANQQGLDALFVAGGIHAADLVRDGAFNVGAAEKMCALAGVRAAYCAPALVL